jgi:ComF family protein
MKYHGQLALCHFFSQQLIRELTSRPHPKLLLPIPLHPKRLKERGFNQSWEITKSLSKALKIDTNASILVRSKDTKPQATLPYSERKKNLHGAFSLTTAQLPDHIALIDDVLTTGHTAQEAAKCLKKVGVKRVELWTIARSIGHD